MMFQITRRRQVNCYIAARMLLCMLLAAITSSCGSHGRVPVTKATFKSESSEVPITRWQLAGPFFVDQKELETANAEEPPLNLGRARDYLTSFGLTEASVDEATFSQISTKKSQNSLSSKFSNKLVVADKVNHVFFIGTEKDPYTHGVIYLASVIESPRDQDIAIAAGVTGSMQLWLNHERIISDQYSYPGSKAKFQHIVGAKLKRGKNFLLVKIAARGDWFLMDIIATLFPQSRALGLAQDNAVNPILASGLIRAGQPLVLRSDLLLPNHPADLTISDFQHRPIISHKVTSARVSLLQSDQLEKENIYFCNLSVDGKNFETPLYYGDPASAFKKSSDEVHAFDKSSEVVKLDLQSQMERLRHLLLPDSVTSPNWDEKVVRSIAELTQNLADLHQNEITFRHAPGTHMRAYRSTVDNQFQHYWLHVPARQLDSGKPLPLVIVLPFNAGNSHPFLESFVVASFIDTESYRMLGDEYGFAVLQVWGRNEGADGSAIEASDVFDAMRAVGKDYNIDTNRIYLMGYCEGGRRALLLGERYPGHFAAIAAEHPLTGPLRPLSRWSRSKSPYTAIHNLIDTPVFISHDEGELIPPFHDSEEFTSYARDAGLNITLVRKTGAGSLLAHGFSQAPFEDMRSMFESFRGMRLSTARRSAEANSTTFPTMRNGVGPIEEAYGSPILVVAGTRGTPEQNSVIQEIVTSYQEDWRKAYFVDCPVKKDTEVTAEDIRSKNLIIIGDQDTNSLMRRIGSGLPIHNIQNGISVEKRLINGDHLGYVFIAPNPINAKRSVVQIGMNQWNSVKGWDLSLARTGDCDYFIFDLNSVQPELIGAGYWTQAASLAHF